MEKVVDITAKRDGFRRAGMSHSDTLKTYPLSQFTKAQLQQLQAEPMLVVAIRDSGNSGSGLMDEMRQQIVQQEGDIQTLTSQQSDLLEQVSVLTAGLDAERQNVQTLTDELALERQAVAQLRSELDDEQKKVTDLTEQLAKATAKKGK